MAEEPASSSSDPFAAFGFTPDTTPRPLPRGPLALTAPGEVGLSREEQMRRAVLGLGAPRAGFRLPEFRPAPARAGSPPPGGFRFAPPAAVTPEEMIEAELDFGRALTQAEENLPPAEVQAIAEDFARKIKWERLTEDDVNGLSQYFIDHVQNPQLRGLLLETMNIAITRPESRFEDRRPDPRGFVFTQTGDDIVLTTDNPAGAERARRVSNAAEDISESIRSIKTDLVGNVRRQNEEFAILVDDNRELLTAEFESLKARMSQDVRRKAAKNLEAASALTRAGTARVGKGRADGLRRLAEMLKGARQDIPLTVPRFKAARASSTSNRISDLPNAKSTLKAFAEELQRDLRATRLKGKQDAKKSKGVQRPTLTHNIGDIHIFSDSIMRVKEISIPPHVSGNDLIKLVLALTREDGVLVGLDGTEIADIRRGQASDSLLQALFKLIVTAKEPIRMLYKPAFPLGGHFLGGSFTDALFNRFEPHRIITSQLAKI